MVGAPLADETLSPQTPAGMLAGKVVIVAGAGPGLGRQVAIRASAAGASVMLAARSQPALDELTGEITASGGRVASRRADVTDESECAALVNATLAAFGHVDCLVYNAFAAGPMDEPIERADMSVWRQAFEVNVFGALHMVRAVTPAMRAAGGGSIVLVNSQIVRRVRAGRGAYAASKAALLSVGQVLARELGGDRIRVNSVVPGAMDGAPLRAFFERAASERGIPVDDVRRSRLDPLALPEIPTDAECAGAVLFLASDLAVAMTGQSIDVNGGETLI